MVAIQDVPHICQDRLVVLSDWIDQPAPDENLLRCR